MSGKSSNFSKRSAYELEGYEDDYLESDDLEAIPSYFLSETVDKEKFNPIPTSIHGPPSLQVKLGVFLEKYKQVFRNTIGPEAALLPPFELVVDQEKWELPKNRGPPRRQTDTRAKELKRQIDVLVDVGGVRPSRAHHYSHAFLVPKPDGEWRFVLDYINLNYASKTNYSHPIPRIEEMLRRLGDKRPLYFAVVDLTAGYHQIPIAQESIHLTAFTCIWGIFEWLRLPMGLKGAASYFQQMMWSIVLVNLIARICESYLDDIIITGSTEDEFMTNLELVFERFINFNITLKASKCRFGLSQVEYVGRLIDATGTHFTESKLDSILNIAKPITQKHLKSFLGLANWFREHVQNYSIIAIPLQKMDSRIHN